MRYSRVEKQSRPALEDWIFVHDMHTFFQIYILPSKVISKNIILLSILIIRDLKFNSLKIKINLASLIFT